MEPIDVPTSLSFAAPTAAAMRALGLALGRVLRENDVIGLDGLLGVGKTCFVQGLARGLGVPAGVRVGSPSFTLINEYQGRLMLYHVDLYRLRSEEEIGELGLWETQEAGGVMAIEWLSLFPRVAPADHLQIDMSFTEGGKGRTLHLRALGPRARARLQDMRP